MGAAFPARCWLRPWRASSGLHHLVTVEDITELEQTKEVLDRSEQRFRQILKNAPDVAWTSDLQGQTLYISPKVEAVLGYSRKNSVLDSNYGWGVFIRRILGGCTKRTNCCFRTSAVWTSSTGFGTRTESGSGCRTARQPRMKKRECCWPTGFLCDITERKEAEAELQFQTAFLEAQANSTIDGILVVDPAGRTLLRNQRFAEIFQLPKELQANREEGGTMRHAAALMKNPELFLSRVEYLYQHPNETARDELELQNGMFLDRYSSPVVDKNGVYYGRIWTFRDITESKRNQDELQQLSLAVEQSPVSVIITDPDGKIGYVNRKFTECSGYTREEVVGDTPSILKSGQTSPDLYRDLWSTVKQGKVWSGEFCNKKKNGEIFWESASITPITNAKGEITHFLAVKEDITGRRKAERDLRLTQFSVDHASEAIQWLDGGGSNRLCERRVVRHAETLAGGADRVRGYRCPTRLFQGVLGQALAGTQAAQFYDIRGPRSRRKTAKASPWRSMPITCGLTGRNTALRLRVISWSGGTLEAQLRQAQKLEGIGHLAAGIAHEINTPTQFVTDNLTFMQDSWKSIFELLANVAVDAKDALDVHIALDGRLDRAKLDVAVLRDRCDPGRQATGQSHQDEFDGRSAFILRRKHLGMIGIEGERGFAPLFLAEAIKAFHRRMAVRAIFPFACGTPLELCRLGRLGQRLARCDQRIDVDAVIHGTDDIGHGHLL